MIRRYNIRMRILTYTLGILALHYTDFGSANVFFSRVLPLVDFAFVVFLLYDFMFFMYRFQDDSLLEPMQPDTAQEPSLFESLFGHWLERYDRDGVITGSWDAVRSLLEWILMMAGMVQAALLLVRALLLTGF